MAKDSLHTWPQFRIQCAHYGLKEENKLTAVRSSENWASMGGAIAIRAAGKQLTDYTYFPTLSAKQEWVFQGGCGLELNVSFALRRT